MTYREVIYSIMDLCKLINDDIILQEEHVIYLINKYRASLLAQKYKNIKLEVAEANYQVLCLDLESVAPIDGKPCEGNNYLRSVCLPKLIGVGNTQVYPYDFYQGINISFISRERMRYTGTNPVLRNIIFCSLNPDSRLYFKSENPQFKYLQKVKIVGVFEDPMEAAKLECSDNCNYSCEPLDKVFPMEEALIVNLQALAIKDIIGGSYRPADSNNDANDDLSDIATFIKLNTKSVLAKQMEA